MLFILHTGSHDWSLAFLVGLRTAVIILYLTVFLAALREPRVPLARALNASSIAILALGLALFSSPPQLFTLLDHPLPASLTSLFIGIACALFCGGAILNLASRGLSNGGCLRDVVRGAAINLGVVFGCIAAAYAFA